MSGPFDFDAEYGGDEEIDDQPAGSAEADRIVANLTHPETVDEADDSYMEDVDQRIEVAIAYRQLLKGDLFEVDTKETQIVQAEVRRFVRARAKELVGLAGPGPGPVAPPVVLPLPFSPEEITALKLLAQRLMASPTALKAPEPEKKEPKLRKASAPEPKQAISQVPATSPAPPRTAAPAAAAPKRRGVQKKQVVNPDTGELVTITKVQRQNPAGRLPWPSPQQMTILTAQAAMSVTPAAAVNIERPDRTGSSSETTAALAAMALRQP